MSNTLYHGDTMRILRKYDLKLDECSVNLSFLFWDDKGECICPCPNPAHYNRRVNVSPKFPILALFDLF